MSKTETSKIQISNPSNFQTQTTRPTSETIFIIFIVDNKSYRSLLPQKKKTFPYPTAHFYNEPHSCLKSQTRHKILKYSINSDNKLFAKPWIIVMQAMHLRHYRPGAILISNLGSKYSIINQSMPKFKKVGELHFSGIDGTIVVGEIIITLDLLLL